MTGKSWLVMALGIVLASSGCVTCCHESAKAVLESGPTCEAPACDRQKVYVALINGATPLGLDGLRDRLAANGFAKVYCGSMGHAGWFKRELVRVCCEEPGARFVIVGYDMGCQDANGIAADVLAAGVPVDAVILIDPVATRSMRSCPTRRILVTCGYDVPCTPHSERAAVCGANHFTLPTHPQTVALVLGVLGESASQVEHPPVYEEPVWRYEHAPPVKVPPTIPTGFPAEWLYLEDQTGVHNVPLSPVPECPVILDGPRPPTIPLPPELGPRIPWLLPQPRLLP